MQRAWSTPVWNAPTGVRALVTTRILPGHSQPPFDRFNLGSRCGDDPVAVAANRARLVDLLELPAAPRWLHQVHGIDVVADPGFDEPEADAATTRLPCHVLAVLTADCLPIVFAAGDGSEIAVGHAGWRGLCAGVVEATVAAMQTSGADLCVWLGPAAGPSLYEVDAQVRDAFITHSQRAAEAFAVTRPGHWHVDLYALARQRLEDAGVSLEHVSGGELCTISDPQRFYSHRRDRQTGRMATLAWISS